MADYIYKEETTDKGMNPLTVAMLGAIAGAVGTGVAMVLSNPKNRRKVQQSMKDAQQWIDKTNNGVKKNTSDMHGKEITLEIKENAQTQHIPVILVSAAREAHEIASQIPVNGFIEKPFEMELLLKTVRSHLS